MSNEIPINLSTRTPSENPPQSSSAVIIVSGNHSFPTLNADDGLGIRTTTFADLQDHLTVHCFARVVVTPLIENDFDAFEVASLLVRSGYKGELWAYSSDWPHAGKVSLEISQAFPSLKFSILTRTSFGRLFRS